MDSCSVYLDFYVSNDGCLLPKLDTESSTEWSYTIFACLINMKYFFLVISPEGQGCNMSRSCDSTQLLSNIQGYYRAVFDQT